MKFPCFCVIRRNVLSLFLATDMGIARSEFLEEPGTIIPLASGIILENTIFSNIKNKVIFTQIKSNFWDP